MADSIFLALWFPSFAEGEMLGRMRCVLEQFPFSESQPGIGCLAVHGVSWSEPPLMEQVFDKRASPEQALALAGEFLHQDSAYIFEAAWDLWRPAESATDGCGVADWAREPHPVMFTVQGERFEENIAQEQGHIAIDLGLDAAFLPAELETSAAAQQYAQHNLQQLVNFTGTIEKNCGIAGRLLWSESEENLAQKLIARLQKVQ